MIRLGPGNSGGRMRGNHEMGNEDKLRLKFAVVIVFFNPLTLSDQICVSSHCQPYNSYVSSENSVLDQLIILKLIFFLIPITYPVDIVLIL